MDFFTTLHSKIKTSVLEQKCAVCGAEAKLFKDTLSEREYQISGMCQACQDWAFKEPEGTKE